MRPELDPAGVELAQLSVESDARRGGDVARDAVGPDEVPAGAARDDGQLDALPAGDPVERLVDGAVPSDDDQQPRAALRGFLRELAEMTAPLGEKRVADEALRGSGTRDLRPALARGAVVRRRVDEEDSLAAQLVTVASAS